MTPSIPQVNEKLIIGFSQNILNIFYSEETFIPGGKYSFLLTQHGKGEGMGGDIFVWGTNIREYMFLGRTTILGH